MTTSTARIWKEPRSSSRPAFGNTIAFIQRMLWWTTTSADNAQTHIHRLFVSGNNGAGAHHNYVVPGPAQILGGIGHDALVVARGPEVWALHKLKDQQTRVTSLELPNDWNITDSVVVGERTLLVGAISPSNLEARYFWVHPTLGDSRRLRHEAPLGRNIGLWDNGVKTSLVGLDVDRRQIRASNLIPLGNESRVVVDLQVTNYADCQAVGMCGPYTNQSGSYVIVTFERPATAAVFHLETGAVVHEFEFLNNEHIGAPLLLASHIASTPLFPSADGHLMYTAEVPPVLRNVSFPMTALKAA
jgi:hypothetical protein